ncbi:MAG: hypothetical protein ACI9WU_000270 [Myxococcota bacterium]
MEDDEVSPERPVESAAQPARIVMRIIERFTPAILHRQPPCYNGDISASPPTDVLVVRPRVLRQIIDNHRNPRGWAVPHGDSYRLSHSELERIIAEEGLLLDAWGLPDPVLLIAEDGCEIRHTRHVQAHALLDSGLQDLLAVAAFCQSVGPLALEEARAVLVDDQRLFAPEDNSEVARELAATWVEWSAEERRHFFPSLDPSVMQAALGALSETDLPRAPGPDAPIPRPTAPVARAASDPERLQRRAEDARLAGNHVRAIAARARARRRELAETDEQLETDLHSLTERLETALAGPVSGEEWRRVLRPLAYAPGEGRWSPAIRLLYDLQKICAIVERPAVRLDVARWLVSRGEASLRRPLTRQVRVRVHRYLRKALDRAGVLDPSVAEPLCDALDRARIVVSSELRTRLAPRIRDCLRTGGIQPRSIVEQVAEARVADGLIDRILERDYIAFQDLRDAISQDDLKLSDISGPVELLRGDALLSADRALARELDGIYRRSPGYMRGLQRASAVAFGNAAGRAFTRYAALPFLLAFVILEALQYIVRPLAGLAGMTAPPLVTAPSVIGLSLLVALHVNSERVRANSWRAAKALYRSLRGLLIDGPRWLADRPAMKAFLQGYAAVLLRRFVVRPLLLAVPILLVSRLLGLSARTAWLVFGASALTVSLALTTPPGKRGEARLIEAGSTLWTRIRYGLFMGLINWLLRTSRRVQAAIERVAYTVDEYLRFREGDPRLALVSKLILGSAWAVLTWAFQLVIDLFVEPQINPIKHFPIVTVSHKVLLSQTTVFTAIMGTGPAAIFLTVAPGFVGFLAWELTANWRLYDSGRPARVPLARIGSHGETGPGLLVPGFHSGTIPTQYRRLRNQARGSLRQGPKEREALHHAEQALTRFFDRHFCALAAMVAPDLADLRVTAVHCGVTHLVIELNATALTRPIEVTIRQRHDALTSEVSWPHEPTAAVRRALKGALQRAGADADALVWRDWKDSWPQA